MVSSSWRVEDISQFSRIPGQAESRCAARAV
jgi:hypothetical protein